MEELVALASKYNVAVVPIGGGTNVTGAVDCKHDEQRMIVSLDTSQMVTFFILHHLSDVFKLFFFVEPNSVD